METLTIKDLVKDAQRIREFRGDGSYALTSFIREVDTLLPLLASNVNIKNYVYQRIIVNKIQGPALDAIRTLGPNARWQDIKDSLVANFGVKETYHNLYQQAFSARCTNVRNYFTILRDILSKLNEKYEYDSNQPTEFKPTNNESIILKTFLNNIDTNLSSVIINKNVTKLRDAFNLLETENLLRERNTLFNKRHFCIDQDTNKNHFKPGYNQNYTQRYQNTNHNPPNNTNYNPRQTNSGQFTQRYQNNNPYHPNYNSNQKNVGQFNNFRRDMSRNNTNAYLRQTLRNEPSPMEVDHMDHELNFPLTPTRNTYL